MSQSQSRRSFLQTVGSLGLLAACSPAAMPTSAGGQAAAPKEPHVWLEMTQAELDAAYSQSVYAPNLKQVLARYSTNSDLARGRMKPALRFNYGNATVEGLDVFVTDKPNAPIHLFVHGGAWSGGSAREYAFLAEMFVAAGAHVVMPDFDTVQANGGSLLPLADQLRRAVVWLYENAKRFNGDATRIHVSGHSSGAHLAAVLLTTDWKSLGLMPDVIKTGLVCSGMFDLKAVRLSSRSKYIRFTDSMEEAMSPQRHLQELRAPIVVAFGTLESPEFQRQSRDFVTAVAGIGKPVRLMIGDQYNHFEILETLGNPFGLLGRAALEQMALV